MVILKVEHIALFTLTRDPYGMEMVDQVMMTLRTVIEYRLPCVEDTYLCNQTLKQFSTANDHF